MRLNSYIEGYLMPKETKLIMEVWRRFLKSQSARRSQERFKQTGKRKTIPPEAFDRMIGGYDPRQKMKAGIKSSTCLRGGDDIFDAMHVKHTAE